MLQLISRYRKSINPPYKFKDYLNLGFTLLFLLALPVGIYLSQQKQDIRQHAQEENRPQIQGQQNDETVKGLTLAVLKLNREQNQAPEDQKKEVSEKLISNLKQRQQTMANLIEQAPQAALKIGLPTSIKNQFPQDVQSTIEEEISIDGTIEVLHSDEIDPNSPSKDQFSVSRFYYYLKPDTGSQIQLFFASNPPEILSDSKVQVHGLQLGDKMAVASSDETNFKVLTTTANVLGTSTTKKVAVILINFQNNATQPYTADFARSVMFTSATSANSYYKEISFGKLSLEGATRADGDIFGWYTIPYDNTTCSYSTWATAAKSKAQADGFIGTNYTNIEYAFPQTSTCTWWGLGSLGGSPAQSWVNGLYALRVTAHELGHNFGTHHANSYNCTDALGVRVAISSTCTSTEYGDPFDVMGSSTNHFNNFHKGETNFLDATNTQTVTTDGDYAIGPIEKSSAGVSSLRTPKDVSSKGTVKNYYYLEFRQPFGFDNFSSTSPVVNGVTIRMAPDYTTLVQSQLIDTTPSTTSFSDAPLLVGQTFNDPIQGLTVNTLLVAPERAQVHLTFGPGTCVRSNPSITISPLGQYGTPGQTLTYTVSVTNNDSSACTQSTFTITPTLLADFSQTQSPASITLSPASSGSTTISLTSGVSTPEGFYGFMETATNSADTKFSASASANYNIIQPDTTPPTVTIASPAAGSTLPKITVKVAASASDTSGIAQIQLLIDSNIIKTCPSTTSCQTVLKTSSLASGPHTITATATDTAPVHNSASSSITVYK